jgi:hypothetical protein
MRVYSNKVVVHCPYRVPFGGPLMLALILDLLAPPSASNLERGCAALLDEQVTEEYLKLAIC